MPYLSEIKTFLYGAIMFIVMGFIGWFKYRGQKIDDLEQEVQNHEAKDRAQDFEADNREAAARAEAEDAKNIASNTFTI